MGQVNLGTAQGKIVVDGSGARAGFDVAKSAAQAFFDVVADRVNELEQVGDRLTKIGAVAAGGFGLAINAAAGFEQRLSAIEAVSGATGDQMDAISKKALQLGADTKFSASEAAQAMEELVKAGLTVDDVLNGAADATVALAAAGEIDLPRAAEIAANAMSVFNLSAADMPRVADLIAGAANASAIDVEQFAQSLSQSGAAANLAGLKFEDLSTAIAIMGNAGIKGSDAGTSLKTMLLNLNPVTEKQKGLMKELGIITKDGANQFFNAEGKAKSFGEIAGVLQGALKGMTKQQQLATLEILFGSDAIRAAAVVADAGTKGFEDMAAAMGKVKAADVAATRMDNLRGAMEELKGSLETAGIIIGRYFLPALQKMAEGVTKAINVFNDAPESVQKFLTIVVALGGGLSLLTGIFIKLAFVLAPLLAKFLGFMALKQIFSIFTTGFRTLKSGQGIIAALSAAGGRATLVFGRFGTAAKGLFGAIRTLIGAVGALRIAVGFAFGPWGALIAGIIAAVVLLYKKFEPFKELVDKIGRAIKGTFLKALEAAEKAILALVDGFNGITDADGVIGFFQDLGATARELWDELKEIGNAWKTHVQPVLEEAGSEIWQALKDNWDEISAVVRDELVPALKDFWEAIQPILPLLPEFARQALLVVGALIQLFAAIGEEGLKMLLDLAELFVREVIPAFIQAAPLIIAVADALTWLTIGIIKAGAALTNFGTDQINGLKLVAAGIGEVVTTLFNWFVQLPAIISTAAASVATSFATFFAPIMPIIQAGMNLISEIIRLGMETIRLIFYGTLLAIITVWQTTWNGLVIVAQGVWSGIIGLITTSLAIIQGIISAVLGAIVAVAVAIWRRLSGNTTATWSTIQSTISSKLGAVRAVVSAILSSISATVKGAWNAVKTATSAAWNGILSMVKARVQAVVDAAKRLKDKIVSFFSGSGGWLKDAGTNLVQGFIDGISGMIGAAADKVKELADLAKQAVAERLKIGSPSKVFEDLGKFTIEGYIKGVDKMSRPLEGLMDDILATTIPISAIPGLNSSPTPKIVLPKQQPPKFPQTVLLDVDGRTMRAYVRETADGVLADAASKVGRGRK